MRKLFGTLVSVFTLCGTAHGADLGRDPSSEIFSAMKAVAGQLFAGKTLREAAPPPLDPSPDYDYRTIHFDTCGFLASEMGLSDDYLGGAPDLAAFIVLMRAQLKRPELQAAAEPYLRSLERIAVDRLDHARGLSPKMGDGGFYSAKLAALNSLATTLNQASSPNKSSSDFRYVVDEGCGGGEIHVKLITRPPSAKVYVIKLFDYTLCNVRRIDPSDKERCFGWMPNAPSVLDMSGWYKYQAIWPDGKVTEGRFSVTKKQFFANADEDAPMILTLSR